MDFVEIKAGKNWARLYCADCLTVLPTLGKVDCIVSDPPYGVEAVNGAGKCFGTSNAAPVRVFDKIAGDDRPFDPTHLLEMKVQTLMWGANHYADKLPASPSWFVWDKRDGTASNPLADCELAWSNFGGPARLLALRWMGMIRATDDERGLHPTQKPIALFSWLMTFAPQGVVLDPYMGSGPCGVAAIRSGRDYIGIECSKEYFAIAERRIRAEANQRKMF